MKLVKQNLKCISYMLMGLMILQSCTIYYSTPSSVDKAIASQNKVKVDVKTDEPYKFRKIEKLEDGVYGRVKRKSSTFNKLKNREIIYSKDSTYAFVKLTDLEKQNIRLKNKTASTIITIAIPLIIVGALIIWAVDETNHMYDDTNFPFG